MYYNMDFLFAALVIMFFLMYHFLNQREIIDANSRIFKFFLYVGIADITFDIVSTLLIFDGTMFPGLTRLALTILYLLQDVLPYALLCYTLTLRSGEAEAIRKRMTFWFVPTAVLALLIIANYWGEWLFGFTDSGRYYEGPLYYLMYVYAAFYGFVIVVSAVSHYKELGRKRFIVICEFFLVEIVCVAIQAVSGELLMTGFGIAVGTLALYLSINNPGGYMDHLTGVFDRQFFEQWIREELNRRRSLYFVTVDIHNLERVNKIFGSSVGNRLLLAAAEELYGLAADVRIFRIRDNRFLLAADTLEEYQQTKSRVRKLFDQPFLIDGETIFCTAVICGIMEDDCLKAGDTILAYIDYLVSCASNLQETTEIQGDERMMEGFRYEQEIERYLKTAVEKNLFEVYYQPIYSLHTGDFISLEALSRLYHPSLGSVPPQMFMAAAEKNGLISRIGYLQFRRICQFVKENEDLMEKIQNIKFNLSPLDLLKPGFIRSLLNIISEYGLPCRYFQFEITETVATEYSEELERTVEDFLEAGVGLCLDDFGSGYANLNTVLKLPFSSIKLDHSLLDGISSDEQIAAFYQSIVSVLQTMGYRVISEGVETEEEARLLRTWGVDMIQGYYYAHPLGEEQVRKVLTGNWKRR